MITRHGETEHNRRGAIQGRIDSELSPVGLKQAKALAKRLEKEEFSVIYCSTLKRAIQTAQEIAALHPGVKIVSTPALDERSFGELEGMMREEIFKRYPNYKDAREAHHPETAPPGGESKTQMVARVKPFLEKIIREHEGETIVLVSHGGMNTVILSLLLRLPLENTFNIKQANVCVNEVRLQKNGKHELVRLNDTSHLEPLRDTLDNEVI
ncbi:MAG: histidine phosphatase family protein [Candidatus Norongarragalinales archaeon]